MNFLKRAVNKLTTLLKRLFKATRTIAPVVASIAHVVNGGSFTGALGTLVGTAVWVNVVYWYLCELELQQKFDERAEERAAA